MVPGYAFVALALLATLIAFGLFLAAQRAEDPSSLESAAKCAAAAAAALVACASGYLVYLIATHQFQVAYVAEFSRRNAQGRYLVAAFWGGQEGSILLWTLWTAVLGAVLAYRSGGKAARVWPIFAVLQTFLLTLVLVKSPFKVAPGPAPADGQGLNPLLENHWMVIHPPILFLGFSSLVIPWVWAMYGLIYKDWDGWVKRAHSWAIFAFAVEGFGIALGGFWAYETLGWGGFWGWDPVENSSLVPWLFMIGLLHGIPIQRNNGGFKVSNFMLGVLPFAFMCYGTFLTRSGLLADFSVHSFSSLGGDGFAMLLGFVIFAFAAPAALLAARFRSIPKPTAYSGVFTREFGQALASALLAVAGFITAVGVSAPIITRLWLAKGAGAQPDYYNHSIYPLAVAMMILLSVTPFLAWRSSSSQSVWSKLIPAYIATLAATVLMFALGCRKPWMLLLFAGAVFAVLANITQIAGRMRLRKGRLNAGGLVAHVGAGMLLTGVACLVAFSQHASMLTLIKGQPVEALGYRLTYLGMTSQPYDRDNAIKVQVEKDGHSWLATPHLYTALWQGQDQQFANPPDIHNFLWGDLYMAHDRGPNSIDMESPNNGVTLHRGDSFSYGDYHFAYNGLTWASDVHDAMMTGGPAAFQSIPQMHIHANLDVTYHGVLYQIKPDYVFDQTEQAKYPIPAALPGPSNAIVAIDGVDLPSNVTIQTTNLPDPYEFVQVDLSTKPMIWLVWLGTILYTLGGLAAYRARARQYAAQDAAAETIQEPEPVPAGRPMARRRPARVGAVKRLSS